ncbi:MAG: OmpH family outer membrane protein [Alphaproteobacteria bacterium]|jgi:outer membrane protein|nr:OmpH family outer membrane protein [Alphaproteobacteria bacterium]MBT5389940.1 OmpH family outer membrane protein [Alphaproteobacteria bacterium]MBT5540044.1 OmpH family outer membrane protein [Alphaproteobacteria bacterium]MBT5654452.1 OmpH family outer membrane protein [Alphaproteobacteria bacterium]
MKILKVTLLSAVVAAFGFTAAQAALPAPTIGVVDKMSILQKLPVIEKLKKDVESHQGAFKAELAKYEKDFRAAEEKLQEDQKKLSQDELAKKYDAYQKRLVEVNKIIKDRKEKLEKPFVDAMTKVDTAIQEAVSKVAKEKGLNLVLYPMSVAYADSELNVTDEVAAIVKKTLPEIKIEAPKK